MATCFVVQGFGEKTDFATGRKLNLDRSYAIIEDAVKSAGHDCVRADQIVHSGSIDQPMYEYLLNADLVIADLSCSNVNAAFELGVRYGLRPHATIVVAEQGFTSPFDVNHIVIRRYEHLGPDLGYSEARRFAAEMRNAVTAILGQGKVDSPVYTFISRLRPPRLADEAPAAAPPAPAAPPPAADAQELTAKALLDLARAKINPPPQQASDFAGAIVLLQEVRKLRPNDAYITQLLALATYKGRQPTPGQALRDARELLRTLQPQTTNDPETLGLWGAVHKRLWELEGDPAQLGESIDAYSRGFYLKQDYYNGLNYAYLLELRALGAAAAGQREDAIADRVIARRVRQDVKRWVAPQVEATADLQRDDRYWITASMWEACAGLGDAEAPRWEQAARALQPAQWMIDTTAQQIANIGRTQAQLAPLLA